jgi:hypothetical protein
VGAGAHGIVNRRRLPFPSPSDSSQMRPRRVPDGILAKVHENLPDALCIALHPDRAVRRLDTFVLRRAGVGYNGRQSEML